MHILFESLPLKEQTLQIAKAQREAFAHGQVDAFFLLPDLAGWNLLALGLVAALEVGAD